MLHGELSRDIIGAAMTVLNALKPGLSEKVYENALIVELRHRGHTIDQQSRFDVIYRGTKVGLLVPDVIVDRLIIVETKVVSAFTDEHLSQVLGYLTITELDIGLLLNFKNAILEWKRMIRTGCIDR